MIRRLQPGDAVALLPLVWALGRSQAITWEDLGHTTSSRWRIVRILRHALSNQSSGTAWFESSRRRVCGIAAARPRSGPRAWEVDYLAVRPEGDGPAAMELLEALSVHAGRQGTERIFLRTADSSPLGAIAQRSGFFPGVEEHLYVRIGPCPPPPQPPPDELREAFSGEDLRLFRLYHAATPTTVRTLFGLTLDQWRDARELPGRRGAHMAWVEQDSLRAWAQTVRRGSTTYLEVVAHPQLDPDTLARLVAYATAQVPPQHRLLCLVPAYDVRLAHALEEHGFSRTVTYHVWVRGVATPATEPSLAPAQA